jgi:DNA-binding transcriptional LysR family regulator
VVAEPERVPERLHRWPLFSEPYVVICPAGHRLAAADAVPPAALAEEVLLVRDGEGSDCEAWLERHCHAQGIAPGRRHVIAGEDRLLQMVAAGLGVALSGGRQPVPAGTVARPLAAETAERAVILAAVAGRQQGPGVAAFLKLMRARDWRDAAAGRQKPASRGGASIS